MKKKPVIILSTLVLLAIGVGVIVLMSPAPPTPPRDLRAEMKTIEEALDDGRERDVDKWDELVRLAEEHERLLSRTAATVAQAEGVQFVDFGFLSDEPNFDDAIDALAVAYRDAWDATRFDVLLADPATAPPYLHDRPGDDWYASTPIDDISALRGVVRAQRGLLEFALRTGDTPSAVAAFRRILAISACLRRSPALLAQLPVAFSESSAMYHVFVAWVQRSLTPSAIEGLLTELVDHLERNDRQALFHASAWGTILHAELAAQYAGHMPAYTDVPRPLWASLERADAMLEAYTEALVNGIEDKSFPAQGMARDAMPALSGWSAPRYQVAWSLMPMMDSFYFSTSRETVRSTGLALGLAADLYAHRHGAPPASLEHLVESGVLERLPPTPFVLGGTLVYRLNPASRFGYDLYAPGADETDNGGVVPDVQFSNDPIAHPDAYGYDSVWKLTLERPGSDAVLTIDPLDVDE